MPKSKSKLLYVAKFLTEKTDEDHPASLDEIITYLGSAGISAERKSLYDDFEQLKLFGMDILRCRGKKTGYYIGSRTFELAELKLLVDSVQTSRFITEKKTRALIRKLESLTSESNARSLQRQVLFQGRKSENETVFLLVDALFSAISNNRTVTFQYFNYSVSKQRVLKRGGELYEVSPFSLTWDDENYYLIAWDDADGKIKHFRVDKMLRLLQTDRPRRGREAFEQTDFSDYRKSTFGMFGGEKKAVQFRCDESLAGAMVDRFGRDIPFAPCGSRFTFTAEVCISPLFFGWLFSFGDKIEVLSPPSVRSDAEKALRDILKNYAE